MTVVRQRMRKGCHGGGFGERAFFEHIAVRHSHCESQSGNRTQMEAMHAVVLLLRSAPRMASYGAHVRTLHT
jgi:hypothetical protein